MLHWTSSPQLVPYLIFGAAWAFLCGVTVSSGPAHGQPNSRSEAEAGNITIEAPRAPVPGQYYGTLNSDTISLSQAVNYADLDLSKPADVAELEKRVNKTAQDVCRKLNARYPRTVHQFYDDRNCVKDASEQGMAAARRAMAAAG